MKSEVLEKNEVLVADDLRGNTVLKQALLRRNKKYFVVGDLRGHIVFVAIQRERERERERETHRSLSSATSAVT